MWQLTAKLGKYKGASWPVSGEELIIGRAPACDVVVRDPMVSRRHCRLLVEDEALRFEDFGGPNTPLVNGQPTKVCTLTLGDEILVGSASFVVTRVDSDEGTTTTPSFKTTTRRILLNGRGRVSPSAEELSVVAQPRNVGDLSALHELSVQLIGCRTLGEVAEVAFAVISNELPIHPAYIVYGTLDEFEAFPGNRRLSEADGRAIRTCMETESVVNLIPSKPGAGGEVLLPLHVCGDVVGVFAMCDPDDDMVLGLGFCVARTLAPFVAAIGRNRKEAAIAPAYNGDCRVLSKLIGECKGMQNVRRLITLAARSELPILIQGETGTGKELAASLIHELSPRVDGPFLAVNCAALPDELFESEFFGHVKGAFTGATKSNMGLMQKANGGVLFLDEIADLSLRSQARLLRAIETGRFRPVGGVEDVVSDVWVVAASNRDMLEAVREGKFRNDLYFRLAGIEIEIPPLRSRRADIARLADYFAAEYAEEKGASKLEFGKGELDYFASLPWSGNVRELRNAVRRVAALKPEGAVTVKDLQAMLRAPEFRPKRARTVDDVERAHIVKVLKEQNGRISDAAQVLGIHRNTLRSKMKEYGLSKQSLAG